MGMEPKGIHKKSLTAREKEIVGLVAQGKTTKDIALFCFIAEGTVKQHLNKIYKKLGVKTRIEAALFFIKFNHVL